jgi:hypothetical protein
VYIVFQPFHQGRDGSLSLPYQAIDGNGRSYVDWPEKLDHLGDAKTVAGLWAEGAQRYQRTQEQRRAVPAGPDHLGNAVGAGETGSRHQDRGPALPHPKAPAASSTDLQQSGRTTQAVANAASVMAAKASDTTTTNIANNATRNTDSADTSGRNRKPGIRLRLAANALLHRRPTRSAARPGRCEQSADA